MSTVHEVVAASHAGVKTVAISCISNLAAGVAKHALTMEEVMEAGKNGRIENARSLMVS